MEAFEEHDTMSLWWPDAYTTMLQRPYNMLHLSSNHFEENKLWRQVSKLNSLRNAFPFGVATLLSVLLLNCRISFQLGPVDLYGSVAVQN